MVSAKRPRAEFRRTQQGNNNAYCQDNDLSWYDWNLLEKNLDTFRFFEQMIPFRKRHQILKRKTFFGSSVNQRGLPEISWHGCSVNGPGWNDPGCRVLAYTMGGLAEDEDLHVIFNMDDQTLNFELASPDYS